MGEYNRSIPASRSNALLKDEVFSLSDFDI